MFISPQLMKAICSPLLCYPVHRINMAECIWSKGQPCHDSKTCLWAVCTPQVIKTYTLSVQIIGKYAVKENILFEYLFQNPKLGPKSCGAFWVMAYLYKVESERLMKRRYFGLYRDLQSTISIPQSASSLLRVVA